METVPLSTSAGGVEIRDFQGVTVNELNINGGAGRTVQIYASNPAYEGSAKETVYIRGLNLIASVSEETSYYLYNAHGDVVQLTDQVGAVTHEYKYDAFGVELNPGASDANPFRYCGEQYDSETGSIYLRARYYDVQNGRFTTEDTHWNPGNMIYGDSPVKWNERPDNDPLGLNAYTYVPDNAAIRQSGNLYGYGSNNPLMYLDPSGESIALEWQSNMQQMITIDGPYVIADTVYTVVYIVCVLADGYVAVVNTVSTLNEQAKNPDPYAREGQKKQGRENKNKAREKEGFKSQSNKRRGPNPPKRHTPGKDHRKH